MSWRFVYNDGKLVLYANSTSFLGMPLYDVYFCELDDGGRVVGCVRNGRTVTTNYKYDSKGRSKTFNFGEYTFKYNKKGYVASCVYEDPEADSDGIMTVKFSYMKI